VIEGLNDLSKDIQFLEIKNVRFDDNPGFKITYVVNSTDVPGMPSNVKSKLKISHVYLFKDRFAYVLTYTSTTEDYSKYEVVQQNVVNSLKFL